LAVVPNLAKDWWARQDSDGLHLPYETMPLERGVAECTNKNTNWIVATVRVSWIL